MLRNRFGVPALASTFFQPRLGRIWRSSSALWLGPTLLHLTRIEGMAVGVVLGGALQLSGNLPCAALAGFHFRPTLPLVRPGAAFAF